MSLLTFKKENSLKLKILITLVWVYASIFILISIYFFNFTFEQKSTLRFNTSLAISIFLLLLHIGLLFKNNFSRIITLTWTYISLGYSIITAIVVMTMSHDESLNKMLHTLSDNFKVSSLLLFIYFMIPILTIYLFSNKKIKVLYKKI